MFAKIIAWLLEPAFQRKTGLEVEMDDFRRRVQELGRSEQERKLARSWSTDSLWR